jgi:hypothetical protein
MVVWYHIRLILKIPFYGNIVIAGTVKDVGPVRMAVGIGVIGDPDIFSILEDRLIGERDALVYITMTGKQADN